MSNIGMMQQKIILILQKNISKKLKMSDFTVENLVLKDKNQ